MNNRRFAGMVGLAIGLAGLVFVVVTVARDWEQTTDSLRRADWMLFVLAVLVGLVAMTLIGLVWRQIMAKLGADPGVPRSRLNQYFVGQLGKYVPGGIWPIVGRAEMAYRGGVERTPAYGGTLLSLATTYLAALLVGGLGTALALVQGEAVPWWAVLLSIAAPIALLLVHPSLATLVLRLARRVTGREVEIPSLSWGLGVRFVFAHVPTWLGISTATYLVAQSVDSGMPFDRVLVATCFSWFLGFVIVGLPGGLGVREAVFVALAGTTDPAVAATVALLARVAFIAVDLGGAGISTVFAASGRSKSDPG